MSGHTPGPWDFSWQLQPNGCPTVGHKGLMVCMVAHSVKEQDQKETALANANLIAAAPDLLEALIKLLEFWQPSGSPEEHDIQAAGYAAIARAKGEA